MVFFAISFAILLFNKNNCYIIYIRTRWACDNKTAYLFECVVGIVIIEIVFIILY